MTTMKPNAYGLLSTEQIAAVLAMLETGLESTMELSEDAARVLSTEAIESLEAQRELAQEAYELLAAEVEPRHAEEHTVFQLQQAGIDVHDDYQWVNPSGTALPTLEPAAEAHAIRQVLGALGEQGGYAGDQGFVTKLVLTLLAADSENQIKLLHGFPEVTMAVLRYKGAIGFELSGAEGLRARLVTLAEGQVER
jgi:hypothetical protein